MKIKTLLNNSVNIEDIDFSRYVCLVIDVLRSTSTIVAALSKDAHEIIISPSIDHALELKNIKKNYLLIGEEKGSRINGFDYDNSPTELLDLKLKDKSLILKTSNGTKSFLISTKSFASYALSSINLNHATDIALSKARNNKKDILYLCSGILGEISYDDVLIAGISIKHILTSTSNCVLDDSSVLAYNSALAENDIYKAFLKSASGKRTILLGQEEDLEFCSTLNSFKISGIMIEKDMKLPHVGRIFSIINTLQFP